MDCTCKECLADEYFSWWVRSVWGFIIFATACLITYVCW
jgi:hypothetical protein